MSCSNKDMKELSNPIPTSCCGDLPQQTRKKIFAIVDTVNNEMFFGKSVEECKLIVIDTVRASTHSHLHTLTTEDIILVSPEHVKEELIKVHQDKHAVVMQLIRDQHTKCEQTCQVLIKEMAMYQPKQYEPIKPDKSEVRQRNAEYRNRQRFHNRLAR